VRRCAWLLVLAVAAVLAGCSAEAPDFSGVDITIGARDFDEQLVLSSILAEALERSGATVTTDIPTGNLPQTRAALESGEIDAYWEYNSVALVEVFGQQGDPDADGEELTESAAEIDAANGITWVGRSSFSNAYGFGLSQELAAEHRPSRYSPEAFDLEDLADLLGDRPELMVCVEERFVARADGLELFEAGTGFTIPDDQLRVVGSTDEVYELVEDGECDVAEVFTTDSRIGFTGLAVVEDPGIFLTDNVSLTIRDEVYEQAPEAFDALVDGILGALSRQRMIELNGRVAAGDPPDDVAAEFVDEFIDV